MPLKVADDRPDLRLDDRGEAVVADFLQRLAARNAGLEHFGIIEQRPDLRPIGGQRRLARHRHRHDVSFLRGPGSKRSSIAFPDGSDSARDLSAAFRIGATNIKTFAFFCRSMTELDLWPDRYFLRIIAERLALTRYICSDIT